MDNVCHTLAGATLGEAGLKRQSALGMATLMIASNLPDIDVAVFFTDTLAMSFRRGWTHGVLAMAVLPALLAAVMLAWGRARKRPVRWGGLLLLSYVGTSLHIFMDWLNSYGIRLLMPFSERWFYGDALYIVDPLLYVIFGTGIVLARRRERRHARTQRPQIRTEDQQPRKEGQGFSPGPRASAGRTTKPTRPARTALAVAFLYMGAMVLSNWWARAEVRDGLARAGRGDVRFMVTPVFGNPLRREVIVDTGDRYEKGQVWFAPAPRFRPLGYGVDVNADDPLAQQAAATPRFEAFLGWSRFPFFVVDRSGVAPRVFINDYRYTDAGGRDGWATQLYDVPSSGRP